MNLRMFVEVNSRWIRSYMASAKICGWVLVCFGIAHEAEYTFLAITKPDHLMAFLPGTSPAWAIYYMLYQPVEKYLITGLLALVVAQLLQFLLSTTNRPGWFLLNGEWILYGLASLMGLPFIVMLSRVPDLNLERTGSIFYGIGMVLAPELMSAAIKIMIALGLGQVIRRVLPVIIESKSLA